MDDYQNRSAKVPCKLNHFISTKRRTKMLEKNNNKRIPFYPKNAQVHGGSNQYPMHTEPVLSWKNLTKCCKLFLFFFFCFSFILF